MVKLFIRFSNSTNEHKVDYYELSKLNIDSHF